MVQQEQRLRVVSAQDAVPGNFFLPHHVADPPRPRHYLCGSCSIIFARGSEYAIQAGVTGICKNCGALNQL